MILLVDMGENTTTYLRMLDIYWLFKNHFDLKKKQKTRNCNQIKHFTVLHRQAYLNKTSWKSGFL